MSKISDLDKRKQEAVWGMLIGDAIAMPVHWYYKPNLIKRDYNGWLKGFEAPRDAHPTCILHHSATDGSGRANAGDKVLKPVIGEIILHDKLEYWNTKHPTHYHRGMAAGENTLNSIVSLQTLKVMSEVDKDASMDPRTLRAHVMENYVKFMTTPGTHNDTYAESFHRQFFRDWRDLANSPRSGEDIVAFFEQRYSKMSVSTEDYQISVIGGFSVAVPWILHYAHKPEDECARNTLEAIQLTHPAPSLMAYLDLYARLLRSILHGSDLKSESIKTASNKVFGTPNKAKVIQKFSQEFDEYEVGSEEMTMYHQEAVAVLGMHCYINESMPSLLFLAHNFHDDFRNGVLTNANCGGENAHRGAALGALLGANSQSHGVPIPDEWKQQLLHKPIFN